MVLHELSDVFENENETFKTAAYSIIKQHLSKPLIPSENSAYTGLSGTCIALQDAALRHSDDRIKDALHQYKKLLIDEILTEIYTLDFKKGCEFKDYDLISGPAGQLIALIKLNEYFKNDHEITAAMKLLRKVLINACAPVKEKNNIPSCKISPDHYYLENKENYPNGYINLGLAHGVPGILAALSLLTIKTEIKVPTNIIKQLAYFIIESAKEKNGLNWTNGIGVNKTDNNSLITRVAWCYGAPGVCCALNLAAIALHDKKMACLARLSTTNALKSNLQEAGLISPTFCHGEAGVIASALRIYGASISEEEQKLIDTHACHLLNFIDSSHLLGVQEIEPAQPPLDLKGFLSGSSGVAYALIRYSCKEKTKKLIDTSWSLLTCA